MKLTNAGIERLNNLEHARKETERSERWVLGAIASNPQCEYAKLSEPFGIIAGVVVLNETYNRCVQSGWVTK